MFKAVNDGPPEVCMRCGDEAKILPRHTHCQKCKNADQRRQYAARQELLHPDDEDESYKPLPCEIEWHCEQFRKGWTPRMERERADRLSGEQEETITRVRFGSRRA